MGEKLPERTRMSPLYTRPGPVPMPRHPAHPRPCIGSHREQPPGRFLLCEVNTLELSGTLDWIPLPHTSVQLMARQEEAELRL